MARSSIRTAWSRGGSRESSVGVLEQKREIRELEEVVARLETDYQAALARHVATKQQIVEVTRALEELGAAMRADEMSIVTQKKDLDRASDELRRLAARRSQLGAQSADLDRARGESERRYQDASEALEADRIRVDEAERRGERAAREHAGAGRPGRRPDRRADRAQGRGGAGRGSPAQRARDAAAAGRRAPAAGRARAAPGADHRRGAGAGRRSSASMPRSCATRRRCARPRPRRARGRTANASRRWRSARGGCRCARPSCAARAPRRRAWRRR